MKIVAEKDLHHCLEALVVVRVPKVNDSKVLDGPHAHCFFRNDGKITEMRAYGVFM